MRRISTLRSRHSTVIVLATAIALMAALGTLVAGTSSASLARTRAQVNIQCPEGTVRAEGPMADHGSASAGDQRACVPMGQPETFQDLSNSATELAARETAPFPSTAPGAYLHAVGQRNAMLAAGSPSGTGAHWKLAGHAPLCAQETTNPKICPAPNAENGQYSYMGTLGLRTLSGRVSSFAYDPSQQGRYFASPVIGGVWESHNGGVSWHSIGNALPTQAVGALAYDAPLHRILVGTGDNCFCQDGIAGHGIYYSDNDGHTWKHAGGIPDNTLSFKVVVSPVGSSGKTIYAATSKGLFRSDDGGASFHNEDLPTTPKGYSPDCAGNTTKGLCFFANIVTDVVVKPAKSSNAPAGAVIAAVGWRAGQAQDIGPNNKPEPGCTMNGKSTPCLQAPQNGLYESDTGNAGSFKYITGGGSGGTGLPPEDVFGRIALAVAHGPKQNPDAVYMIVEDAQKFHKCQDILDQDTGQCNADIQAYGVATILDGMYASYDFGKSWTKIMDWSQLKQPGTNSSLTGEAGYSPGIQAWYNLWVEADPTATDSSTGDPTRVLFGLEEVWENNPQLPSGGSPGSVLTTPYPTYPGGTMVNDPWIVIGRYWNSCAGVTTPQALGPCNPNLFSAGPIAGTTTHPDQHGYAMIPDGKGGVTLLIGSDGGAYKQHVASGQNFNNDNWGDGQNATMSALQPYDAEMAKDGTIVSGLQDNGEMKIAPNGREAEIFGGDGFFTTINPAKSKDILEEYTYAEEVDLTLDGGASWYNIAPGACGTPTTALFSTPIEQDPTKAGHILLGCTQIQEATKLYTDPCVTPDGGNANNCALANVPFNTVYDLSKLHSPNGAPNIPSALAVRGANEYVAYCGYCDPATQALPFANGIATNVGGKKPPKIGTGNGWHQAKARCGDCHTANGKLPERYITSIQEDPGNPKTVYVTLGGYGRRWIPPGSFGESTANVGVGHLFVSHDHGNHFTNISGNLPDIPANWTAVRDGRLIVATDLGVYISRSGVQTARAASPKYAVLGHGLPAAPVFTVRVPPGHPNTLLISTQGRSDWTYTFPAAKRAHHHHHHVVGHGHHHHHKHPSTKHKGSHKHKPSHKAKHKRGFTG